MSGTTVAVIAIGAVVGALALAAVVACAGAGRQRRRNEHARRVNAARDAVRGHRARNPGKPVDGRPIDDYENGKLAEIEFGEILEALRGAVREERQS